MHPSTTTILILGGGPPSSLSRPPSYVLPRINRASDIYKSNLYAKPNIICLSAGTAHVKSLTNYKNSECESSPQIIYESTSCSSVLLSLGIPSNDVYMESTSYDTIGNAYYSRILHLEQNLARFGANLLVITSDFHMERTTLIFDYIFNLPYKGVLSTFKIEYESTETSESELDKDALDVRIKKEKESTLAFQKLIDSKEYTSLEDFHEFVNAKHGLYSVEKLISRSECKGGGGGGVKALSYLASYGGGLEDNFGLDFKDYERVIGCCSIVGILLVVCGWRRGKRTSGLGSIGKRW